MLKKTITYIDYNGVERTEDFYFNLSKAEVLELEMGTTGGLTEMINKIVAAQDTPTLIKIFKDLVLKAYGEKSTDGRFFNKSEEISNNFMNSPAYDKLFEKLTTDATDEIRDAFSQTEAYSNLFMELATDAEAASKFFNGIIPDNVDKPVSASAN